MNKNFELAKYFGTGLGLLGAFIGFFFNSATQEFAEGKLIGEKLQFANEFSLGISWVFLILLIFVIHLLYVAYYEKDTYKISKKLFWSYIILMLLCLFIVVYRN
jgi:small-conductance mechanosensitive channel